MGVWNIVFRKTKFNFVQEFLKWLYPEILLRLFELEVFRLLLWNVLEEKGIGIRKMFKIYWELKWKRDLRLKSKKENVWRLAVYFSNFLMNFNKYKFKC